MKIVAPAGNKDRFYAAIKGGAQEIYMGLQGFGARRNADNFTVDEFLEALDYAHLRNVRIFLTLNTIMRQKEMKFIYENLKKLYLSGLDAVIVQDLGFAKYIKDNFPNLEIHGSTQMTISDHKEINYLGTLGFKRVVLPRELSFEEIKNIRKNTKVELEVFVSGALCVCYSGNCYMSSFIGSRSGNRGLCAQPCRKLYCDDKGNRGYFLSPKDQLLSSIEIKKIYEIGIDSIKIEGRMKDATYVYETVSYYNEILKGNNPVEKTSKFFNRGYTIPYFYGVDSDIINQDYSFHIGENLGKLKNNLLILSTDIILGDGIIFLDKNHDKISGTYINKILVKNKDNFIEKKFASKDDIILFNNIPKNTKYVFRNFSKKDSMNTEKILNNLEVKSKINMKFFGKKDNFLILYLEYIKTNNEKISCEILSKIKLEKAKSKNTTREDIISKLEEIGNTSFYLNKINIDVDEDIFIPLSLLKNIKRDGIKLLEEKILESYKRKNIDNTNNVYNKMENGLEKNIEINLKKEKDKNDNDIIISAIVSNEEQKKLLENYNIKKIYYKTNPVKPNKNINKNEYFLASSLQDIINNKNDKITINWNLNIINQLTMEVLGDFSNVDTVILSPEMSLEDIKSIGKMRVKKAILIYSRLLAMYTKAPIFIEDNKKIENTEGDKFIINKNVHNNSEIYFEKPLNIINDFDRLGLGVDEYILEFNTETEEEIKAVMEQLGNRNGPYYSYNYKRGVY